ncbi:hypothetical protein SAMN04489731_102559 [Amycolatopsis regifaucium]|nr:hypothetical protein SAMN04489731_102559 [Amycolatopsis regifaucium]
MPMPATTIMMAINDVVVALQVKGDRLSKSLDVSASMALYYPERASIMPPLRLGMFLASRSDG